MTTNIPNDHKYTKSPQIYQITTTHTQIFHSKAFKNILKMGFLVLKYTIWQPRSLSSSSSWKKRKTFYLGFEHFFKQFRHFFEEVKIDFLSRGDAIKARQLLTIYLNLHMAFCG
jgi:hypothetical protein